MAVLLAAAELTRFGNCEIPGKQRVGQFPSQQPFRRLPGRGIAIGEKNAVFQKQAPLRQDAQLTAPLRHSFRLAGGDNDQFAVGYRNFLRQQHRLSQKLSPGGEAVHKGRDNFLRKPLRHQLRRAAACAPNINAHRLTPSAIVIEIEYWATLVSRTATVIELKVDS